MSTQQNLESQLQGTDPLTNTSIITYMYASIADKLNAPTLDSS